LALHTVAHRALWLRLIALLRITADAARKFLTLGRIQRRLKRAAATTGSSSRQKPGCKKCHGEAAAIHDCLSPLVSVVHQICLAGKIGIILW
jgi:cytochrome c553